MPGWFWQLRWQDKHGINYDYYNHLLDWATLSVIGKLLKDMGSDPLAKKKISEWGSAQAKWNFDRQFSSYRLSASNWWIIRVFSGAPYNWYNKWGLHWYSKAIVRFVLVILIIGTRTVVCRVVDGKFGAHWWNFTIREASDCWHEWFRVRVILFGIKQSVLFLVWKMSSMWTKSLVCRLQSTVLVNAQFQPIQYIEYIHVFELHIFIIFALLI